MVAKTRDDAKEAFSRKLNAALTRVGIVDGRGRAAAVAKKLKLSNQAVTKWLTGLTIPDQTNMVRICEAFRIELRELQLDYDPDNREFGNDIFAHKLVKAWPDLDDSVRGQILGFALVQATTRPAAKKDESQEESTGS